jgi:hypothetical protein
VSVSVVLLGGEGDSSLQLKLVSIAEEWGRAIAPDGFTHTPGPLPRAVRQVDRYPLLLIWPVLACWRAAHAEGALDDLDSGCDLVLGPTVDGDLYLIGASRPLPGVLERFEGVLDDRDAVGLAAQTAMEAEIEIGLLRAERPLRSDADVEAALVDPLTPPEVAALLR